MTEKTSLLQIQLDERWKVDESTLERSSSKPWLAKHKVFD